EVPISPQGRRAYPQLCGYPNLTGITRVESPVFFARPQYRLSVEKVPPHSRPMIRGWFKENTHAQKNTHAHPAPHGWSICVGGSGFLCVLASIAPRRRAGLRDGHRTRQKCLEGQGRTGRGI